jgi:RimJ/RimL family protein N-acetyltransferase
MKTRIFSINELKKDLALTEEVFKVWFYSFRMNMTEEEYWRVEENETPEQLEQHHDGKKKKFIEVELNYNKYSIGLFEDNKLIGHLFLREEDDCLVICALGIKHEYRQKGYAKQLILDTINFVKKNHPDYHLISNIHPDNIASLNTHKSIGFIGDESVINDFNSIKFEYKL